MYSEFLTDSLSRLQCVGPLFSRDGGGTRKLETWRRHITVEEVVCSDTLEGLMSSDHSDRKPTSNGKGIDRSVNVSVFCDVDGRGVRVVASMTKHKHNLVFYEFEVPRNLRCVGCRSNIFTLTFRTSLLYRKDPRVVIHLCVVPCYKTSIFVLWQGQWGRDKKKRTFMSTRMIGLQSSITFSSRRSRLFLRETVTLIIGKSPKLKIKS